MNTSKTLRKVAAYLTVAACLFTLPITLPAHAASLDTSAGQLQVNQQIGRLVGAWGFDFLPDGSVIVTEKRGRLFIASKDGSKRRIRGLPEIVEDGQGGLLDIVVARDFEQSQEVFFTHVKTVEDGLGTAVTVARLDVADSRLKDVRTIFEMTGGDFGGRHFGSRIRESDDGRLFVTIGDRGDRPSAQDLSRHNGSVLRINRDGSVPRDNPFITGAAPEIWSYGHRNPQGMDIANDGTIWIAEHGAKGGDEVNLVRKAANYGWPIISYGTHYSGAKIGVGTEQDGMQQPVHYWDPSIAPSGLLVYNGEMFPEWQGDLFVGSLKFDYISRLDGDPVAEVEQLQNADTRRVRDIREAPDGSIWFISEDRKGIFRISR